MQLRLHPRKNKNFINRCFIIKTVLLAVILTVVIFLLDKLELPVPSKLIKKEITYDKIITLK